MAETIIGIDLGTTNSEVAIVENGRATIIKDNGQAILPSAVGFTDDNSLIVGQAAKNQYAAFPERTILSIKRKMGSDETVTLNDKTYTPQEISAMILKRLKSIAEAHCSQKISKAVITVPAYFSDRQRLATKEAGELAGLDVVRIINEPTAAALAYDSDQQHNQTILVYDLGGGTFDVSIISVEEGVVEVISTHGNNQLGGDDFDQKIAEHVKEQLKSDGIEINDDQKVLARIRNAAEIAKIKLSDQPYITIEEEYLLEHDGKPYHLSLELDRHHYEEMIGPFIKTTIDCVHGALQNAALLPADIDKVLLVGGSSRTPLVIEYIERIFDTLAHGEINPELCVALGAAIQGATIAGSTVNTILVDVTSYSFGTSYLGLLDGLEYPYVYKPIIKRNTPLPVTKSEVFFTSHDNQDRAEINIYQGEDEDAQDNIHLGKFEIEGLKKVTAGNPLVIELKLDLDGILQVSAKEKKSGLENTMVINNVMLDSNTEHLIEAKKHIESLFNEDQEIATSNTEDDAQTLKSRATTALETARMLLEKASVEDKEDLIDIIETINDSLTAEDFTACAAALDRLADMLFYLEGVS